MAAARTGVISAERVSHPSYEEEEEWFILICVCECVWVYVCVCVCGCVSVSVPVWNACHSCSLRISRSIPSQRILCLACRGDSSIPYYTPIYQFWSLKGCTIIIITTNVLVTIIVMRISRSIPSQRILCLACKGDSSIPYCPPIWQFWSLKCSTKKLVIFMRISRSIPSQRILCLASRGDSSIPYYPLYVSPAVWDIILLKLLLL